MKPVTAGIFLFIVIVLCGYVVSSSTGVYKIAGFSLGILATLAAIYLHRKTRNENGNKGHF